MDAKCVQCRRVVPAEYEERGSDVVLVRLCAECGVTESLVSTDAEFFRKALNVALTRGEADPTGVIVELLDQCDIQCPTCIAGSSPFLRNLRDPSDVEQKLHRLRARSLNGVFLSGGEPAIHPELFRFMDVTDGLGVSRKVLITNGLRLAKDEAFFSAIAPRLQNGWEVFLQFDVLDSAVLTDIRGEDFVAERERAVALLGEADISTTLVAVAKRGVSLERVHETVGYALSRPWIRGVQIQPIREAGRLENYKSADNTCLASDVHEELRAAFPGIRFMPYVGSPLSLSMAYADRSAGAKWVDADAPDDLYIEPTIEPSDLFRISVMEYSDDHNWSSLRLDRSPLAVLQADGSAKRVDDHWDPVGLDLGPLRVK